MIEGKIAVIKMAVFLSLLLGTMTLLGAGKVVLYLVGTTVAIVLFAFIADRVGEMFRSSVQVGGSHA